jgi:hypothetical protein
MIATMRHIGIRAGISFFGATGGFAHRLLELRRSLRRRVDAFPGVITRARTTKSEDELRHSPCSQRPWRR